MHNIASSLQTDYFSVEPSLSQVPSYANEGQDMINDGQDELIQIILINVEFGGAKALAFEDSGSVWKTNEPWLWSAFDSIDCEPKVDRHRFVRVEEERNVFQQRNSLHVDVNAGNQQQDQVRDGRQLRSDEERLKQPRQEESVGHRTSSTQDDGQADAQVRQHIATNVR